MVAREEGKRGGRVCDEEGSRRGVEVFELSVEGGKTRFARKKLKKAAGKPKLAGDSSIRSCAKSYSYKALDECIPMRSKIVVGKQEGTDFLFYPWKRLRYKQWIVSPDQHPRPRYL